MNPVECQGIKFDESVESVWVEFRNRDGKVFKVGGVYRPPIGCSVGGVSRTAEENRAIEELMLDEIERVSRSNSNVVILGDFNYRGIDWVSGTGNSESSRFLDKVEDCGLYQFVKEETRGDAILDLVFSNDESLIEEISLGSTLGNSDHRMVWFWLNFEHQPEPNHAMVPDFRRADWEGFREELGKLTGMKKLGVVMLYVCQICGQILKTF